MLKKNRPPKEFKGERVCHEAIWGTTKFLLFLHRVKIMSSV